MRRLIFICALCLVATLALAQRITRRYDNESMSKVLMELNDLQHQYTVNFIYDELEDFKVTTDIKHKKLTDAILQIVGFYPVRVVKSGEHEIFVECTHKTDRHLTGTIIDEQGQPVAYANVAILNTTDSTLLSGGVSNESGYFAVPYETHSSVGKGREGVVLACISYVGYKTIYLLCTQSAIGIIRMHPETHRLGEVTVEGKSPILRRDAGTIVFDTRNIAGAINVTDLLRYAPGIMIEDDIISMFGSSGVLFQINGREQRIGTKEMLQMLRSYSASDVEKVEIVQNPGASYFAEGNAGVINIVLKKKDNDYIGGSLGYAHTQYEEYSNETNASVIYNEGKVTTSLNLAGTWDNTRYLETNNISFSNIFRHNTDNGHISNDNNSLRWQADYQVSDRLNLGTYIMYADGERHLTIDGLYDYVPKKLFSHSSTEIQTQRQENTKTWAINLNAVQILGHGDVKIDYNFDYYRMRMGDARHSISNMTFIENNLNEIHQSDTTDFDYQNHIAHTVDNYSAKVDISYAGFKFGTQYTYTRSQQDLDYSGVGSYNHVSSIYDEQIWVGYAEYSRKFGNAWSMNLGGRYEHTWTKGINHPTEYGNRTDYGKLFPSLNIGYHSNHSHTFNWSISNRITRPNIINLNPNRVWRDVNHASNGNQNLKPSYLYKTMIGYSYKGVLSFDLYYAYEEDRIDAVYLINKQVTYASWDNITDEHSLGINSFYYFDKLHTWAERSGS